MEENIIKQIAKDKKIQTKKIIKGEKNTIIVNCMNLESTKAAEKILKDKFNNIYIVEKEKPKNLIIRIVGITGIVIQDSQQIEKDKQTQDIKTKITL